MKDGSNQAGQFKRRLALLAVAALFFCVPVLAQTFELKLSNWNPPNSPSDQELTRWADELNKKSGGRLKISIFPSGQMGPVTRQFDLARTGVADIAFFLHGATPGRFPMTELAQLPYTFNAGTGATLQKPLSNSAASVILTSMASSLVKEYDGTKILYIVASPTNSLMFSRGKVRLPADMKGLRIRHNGPLPAKMIEAWGATPAAIAPVELADSLEKGTVAGMTFNYEALQSFRVAPAIKSVIESPVYAVTFGLVMNAKKYQELPPDLRKLIDDSTGVEGARRAGAKFDEAEANGRKYALENHVEILTPSAQEQEAWRAPVLPIIKATLDADEAKGLPARKFYDELRTRVGGAKQ